MNPFIQNGSRENNFKLLSQRVTVETSVRGSPIFTYFYKFLFFVVCNVRRK